MSNYYSQGAKGQYIYMCEICSKPLILWGYTGKGVYISNSDLLGDLAKVELWLPWTSCWRR